MLSNVNLCIELIKLKPISSQQDNLSKICDFVSEYIQKNCHQLPKIQKIIHKQYPSLIVGSQNLLNPSVCLYAHLDVVDASLEQFEAKIEDNWLIGRGSGDMLGAAAASINTFIKLFNKNPNLNIGLFLPCDEEIGGSHGTKHCLESFKYNPESVLMPDSGSGLDKIVIGQKGFIVATISCKGFSCHSSRPWEGKNPIPKLIEVFHNIQKEFPNNQNSDYHSTIAPTQIHSGESVNQIPNQAKLTLDIRTCSSKEHNNILNILNKYHSETVKIDIFESPAFNISSGHPHIDLAKEMLNKLLNTEIAIIKEHGGSDARYFQKKAIPCIINGIKKENSHGNNEKAYIPEIDQYEEFATEYIQKYHEKFIN